MPESFHLLGHSFGGLISGEYALKHKERVKHLILMSPLGMPETPKRLEISEIKEGLEEGNYLQKVGYEAALASWGPD